jgi:hypothetical protein
MKGRDVFGSRTFARDRRTWIVTLVVAGLLWVGTSAWLNRRVGLAPARPAGPGADGRFVALAFDRVVAVPDGKNLDRLRLRQELRALASAGWQAVTLEMLRDAYRSKASLPAKPILLTFDEGYLGNYEAADPVLRELHWPAVMFLRTERQESRDASFLFWDRLQRMTQSGLWEIASGDPVDPPVAAVADRVPDDPPGAELISDRLGKTPVVAWAPRGTEPLVAFGCVEAGERVWRDGGALPWLGFVDDPVGANDPAANPFRIARLRVDPRWNTDELLRRADIATAARDDADAAVRNSANATAWVPGEGTIHVDANVVRLEGRPRAEIWIPSARWEDNWVLDAGLRPLRSEFWIVQPGGVPGREWRFGGVNGRLYVESLTKGQPPEVLARAESAGPVGGVHRVRIVKRGAGVVVTWDGRPLAPTPITLPERWRGKVGLLAYSADAVASLSVDGLRFATYPYAVRAVAASPSADDVAELTKDASAIAALSPAWVTLEGGAVHEAPFDEDLFRILARRYAWDIVPTVRVKGTSPHDGATAVWLAGVATRVSRERYAGVRLDLSDVPRGASAEWEATARELDASLRRIGKRLVVAAP